MNFFGHRISLVSSRFVVETIFLDWSVDRNSGCVLKNESIFDLLWKLLREFWWQNVFRKMPRLMILLFGFFSKSPYVLNFYPPCISLKNWRLLVYLTIALIVRYFVGRLGFVWLMVPKLGGRCKAILLFRTIKNEMSLIPIRLLIIQALQGNSFCRHFSSICWWTLLVGLWSRFVFAIKSFRIHFYSPRLLLYCLGF